MSYVWRFIRFAVTYATRSLARNRRRSIFLIATVALAVLTSIVANSYAGAVFDFWITSTTETGTGQAQVHKAGYWSDASGLERAYCFENESAVEASLRADPAVLGISRRVLVEGLVSSGSKSIYFSGLGIDSAEEQVVSPQLSKFEGSTGAFVNPGDLSGIVVGRGMADTLELKLGDVVTLSVQTLPESGQGTINGKDVIVSGIIDYPQKIVSKRIIYLNLALAQDLLQIDNRYSEIAIRLKPDVSLAQWSSGAKTEFSAIGAELRPWWDIFPPMRKVEQIFRQIVGVICFLLFVSAGISLLNVVSLTVAERTVEIGILMAVGAKQRAVKGMLAIEAAVMGVFGGAVGILMGNLAVLAMNTFGIPLPNPLFRGFVYIKPEFDILFSGVVFLLGVLICCISTILPAHRAGKVEPVVAFRGQL